MLQGESERNDPHVVNAGIGLSASQIFHPSEVVLDALGPN